MARTTLTKTTAVGAYGDYSVANVADVVMAAADTVNKNQFVASSRDLVIAHNTGGSAYTVTIDSVADPHYGREGDITTYSIGAGEIAVFGPFQRPGWLQSDGYVYLEASNALVYFGVVALPA
jgi:hypothetical protein